MQKKTLVQVMAGLACAGLLAGCAGPAADGAGDKPAQPQAPVAQAPVDANAWTTRLAALKSALETATRDLGVIVVQTNDNQLRVVFPGDRSFDVARAVVKREMGATLDKVAEGLQSARRASIVVVGHTDATGSEPNNERLSQARADNVRAYLISRGLSGDVIETEGRGSSEPLADNATAEGRSQNRRVEIYVKDRD